MSDALEVVLRYLVAWGCAWLVKHGVDQSFADQNFVTAVSTIVAGSVGFLLVLVRALWRSRFQAKLADVAASPAVTSIHATPDVAEAAPSDKVVSVPPAAP